MMMIKAIKRGVGRRGVMMMGGGLVGVRRFVGSEKRPLEGIKVLDLSRVLAGPCASQTLADLGCDVLKIEKPGIGDDTRQWGPPFWEEGEKGEKREKGEKEYDEERKMATYFMCVNRGKRSVELDISSKEGAETIKKLATKADIMIENFKVGGLSKYGLSYKDIQQINPKIIYCSITGFGQNGPLAENAGYDFLIQGMGGLMSVTGTPESGPLKTGVAVCDVMTGLYSTVGILSALHERNISGKGQHVDLSLFDTQLAMMANQASASLVTGKSGGLQGNQHPSICPYEALPCKDNLIILAVGNNNQFGKLCEALDAPELPEDPLFSSNENRVINRATLQIKLKEKLEKKTVKEWVDILGPLGVPAGAINTVSEALAQPQAESRDMIVSMDVPPLDPSKPPAQMKLVGNPIKMSRSNTLASTPPPFLGEHTEEALRDWLGENVKYS